MPAAKPLHGCTALHGGCWETKLLSTGTISDATVPMAKRAPQELMERMVPVPWGRMAKCLCQPSVVWVELEQAVGMGVRAEQVEVLVTHILAICTTVLPDGWLTEDLGMVHIRHRVRHGAKVSTDKPE